MASWSLADSAHADLESIVDYTAQVWGPRQIEIYLRKVYLRLDWAIENQSLWKARDELGSGLHSITAEQHEIFFRADKSGLRVLRLLHVRSDFHSHF